MRVRLYDDGGDGVCESVCDFRVGKEEKRCNKKGLFIYFFAVGCSFAIQNVRLLTCSMSPFASKTFSSFLFAALAVASTSNPSPISWVLFFFSKKTSFFFFSFGIKELFLDSSLFGFVLIKFNDGGRHWFFSVLPSFSYFSLLLLPDVFFVLKMLTEYLITFSVSVLCVNANKFLFWGTISIYDNYAVVELRVCARIFIHFGNFFLVYNNFKWSEKCLFNK